MITDPTPDYDSDREPDREPSQEDVQLARFRHKANFFQSNMPKAREYLRYLHDMQVRMSPNTHDGRLDPAVNPEDEEHFCPSGTRFSSSNYARERSDGVYRRRDRIPRYACRHCLAELTLEWWEPNWRDYVEAHRKAGKALM